MHMFESCLIYPSFIKAQFGTGNISTAAQFNSSTTIHRILRADWNSRMPIFRCLNAVSYVLKSVKVCPYTETSTVTGLGWNERDYAHVIQVVFPIRLRDVKIEDIKDHLFRG